MSTARRLARAAARAAQRGDPRPVPTVVRPATEAAAHAAGLRAALAALLPAARPAILRYAADPACCIASVRVVRDVCTALGARVTPVWTRVRILNPEYVARAAAHGGLPSDPALEAAWRAAGAYQALLGYTGAAGAPVRADTVDGHLVALVESAVTADDTRAAGRDAGSIGTQLVDVSLAQVRLPAFGIVLPPGALDDAPPGFAAGRAAALVAHGACAAVYEAIPGCREHRTSLDWTHPTAWARVVAELHTLAAGAYQAEVGR